MLQQLSIKNFAIIDYLDLDFKQGLTTLTGETGAGKSILIGALGLLLGDRSDNNSVKQGCEYSELVASFDISNATTVNEWLAENELNADGECIIRRRISKDNRSRAYINTTPVNLQQIKELGEMLIDIHGQHEHQSLMKSTVQRQLLDDYAGHTKLLKEVSDTYVQLKLVNDQIQRLEKSTTELTNRSDLLRFQVQELEELALVKDEYRELNEKHGRLANSEQLVNTVSQSLNKLYEDDESNLYSDLSRIVSSLHSIDNIDSRISQIASTLDDALIQIEDSASQLRDYQDGLELDPAELELVENRLNDILTLSRKHRVEPEALFDLHQSFINELDSLDCSDERLEQLHKEQRQLDEKYRSASSSLHKSRIKFAKNLSQQISEAMQKLGMRGGQFIIEVNSEQQEKCSAHGCDQIVYTVSANPGQACKALSRVASGGELARISLAIQMITAKQTKVPTLIFDEVDSGVGGGIAEIVGQHLRKLGNDNQVICITHLPQVASQAHHHLRVHKHTHNNVTQTQVETLNKNQRIEEVARMLSGVEITQQSLAHAKEMISRTEAS